MSELCLSGWKIAEKDATPIWTTLAANQYIPHVAAVDDALETAYKQAATMRVMAAKRAKIYDADRVMSKYWTPALKEIGEGVDAWQASA
jgi:hypothetical protein